MKFLLKRRLSYLDCLCLGSLISFYEHYESLWVIPAGFLVALAITILERKYGINN